MSLEALEFPILRINERGVRKARKARDLRLMPEIFFTRGGFTGATFIIDSGCRKFEVLKITAKRRSFDLLYLLGGKYKMYIVDYQIGSPVQLSFEEVRQTIMDLIVRKRWYLQGGETRVKFVKRFEAFSSMSEVMDSQEGYGRVWY